MRGGEASTAGHRARRASRAGSARDRLADIFDVVTARTMSRALVLLREQEFAGGLRRHGAALGGPLGGRPDPGRRDPRRDRRRRGRRRSRPADHLGQPRVPLAGRPRASRPIGSKFYQALGNPEVLGPDPCPFTSAVASRSPASTVLRIGANRYLRVTVTPGLRRRGHAHPPDRPDPRDHRRDPAAAQGQRDPQGGRRAGRPDSRGTRRDGGRGADRPAQVQHRPPHEGPARARLHRDPPARPRHRPARPAPDRRDDAARRPTASSTPGRRATA